MQVLEKWTGVFKENEELIGRLENGLKAPPKGINEDGQPKACIPLQLLDITNKQSLT